MPSQGYEHRALLPDQASDEFFNVKATGYIAAAHSSGSVLVIGGKVVGDLDLDTTAHGHCVRLASLSKLNVLGVSLARDRLGAEWRFACACAAPSLHDPRAVAATVALMERRAA